MDLKVIEHRLYCADWPIADEVGLQKQGQKRQIG